MNFFSNKETPLVLFNISIEYNWLLQRVIC
nr:MAG TPA: hypothetical protein [Caudoviricetes sp.]